MMTQYIQYIIIINLNIVENLGNNNEFLSAQIKLSSRHQHNNIIYYKNVCAYNILYITGILYNRDI